MLDTAMPLVAGIFLSVTGFLAIIQKHFDLDFGSVGFFNPKPLFHVQLTEARAILFGAVNLGLGIILIGLCVYLPSLQGNVNQNQGLLTITLVLSILLTIFTFLVELFIEYLVWLNRRSSKKKNS